jgi:hypothetical protein
MEKTNLHELVCHENYGENIFDFESINPEFPDFKGG